MSFAKNMRKNIGNKISKNLSSKCSQKPFDYAKQVATGALKNCFKKSIQQMAETTALIEKKIC